MECPSFTEVCLTQKSSVKDDDNTVLEPSYLSKKSLNLIRPQKVLPEDEQEDGLSSDEQTVRKECITSPVNGKKAIQDNEPRNPKTLSDRITDLIQDVIKALSDTYADDIPESAV